MALARRQNRFKNRKGRPVSEAISGRSELRIYRNELLIKPLRIELSYGSLDLRNDIIANRNFRRQQMIESLKRGFFISIHERLILIV
jgi:hypothetical protein